MPGRKLTLISGHLNRGPFQLTAKCVHLANLLFMLHIRVDSLYMQIP